MAWLGPWLGGMVEDPWFSSPFSSDIWDPTSIGDNRGDDTHVLAHAHVDWRETDNAHIFRADLPGLRKEEVKVHVEDGNILQISGERSKEEENKNDKWHSVERHHGSFVRQFRLPENVNSDDIQCSLENGVLTVVVPKTNVESPPRNVRYIDVA
ncbi:hypothetical protein REPUB_Repub16aG0010800 [Reevesia pubescens]